MPTVFGDPADTTVTAVTVANDGAGSQHPPARNAIVVDGEAYPLALQGARHDVGVPRLATDRPVRSSSRTTLGISGPLYQLVHSLVPHSVWLTPSRRFAAQGELLAGGLPVR